MANPRQVSEFYAEARERLSGVELTAHFHNTRGQGLANALAALGEGVDSFESSFGELGGCPVPPGSTGNVSSEDLISMFHEMGIETGVDLERCSPPRTRSRSVLGRPLGAHLLTAGPVEWDGRRMTLHAAFLRGMNVGGQRITNAELRDEFEALGFESVTTFRASGNVIFEARGGRRGS